MNRTYDIWALMDCTGEVWADEDDRMYLFNTRAAARCANKELPELRLRVRDVTVTVAAVDHD